MSNGVISIENVSKRYRLGEIRCRNLKDDLNQWWAKVRGNPNPLLKIGQDPRAHQNGNFVWALRDIDFDVEQGEILGIIGRNGAGKSTILKILSKITAPTSGEIKIRGRTASLLEVGTGFHPDLTGRENIFLNGAILGMKKREIIRKFDEIVEFSGIEPFIDTPVKRYSSGMKVRLAFAVAAHLDPEILIIDEVLAVGDAAFQKKCLGKMGDVVREGRTILFVSHDMAAVENLCDRGLVIEDGKMIYSGDVRPAIDTYLSTIDSKFTRISLIDRTDRTGNGRLRLTHFHIEDGDGNLVQTVRSGQAITLVFSYDSPNKNNHRQMSVGFAIDSHLGQRLSVLYNDYVGQDFYDVPASGEIHCRIDRMPFVPGTYKITARVMINGDLADCPESPIATITVEAGDFFGTGKSGNPQSLFYITGNWRLERAGRNPVQ